MRDIGLAGFLCGHDGSVDLVDKVRPGSSDGIGVAIVGSVVNEEAEVVVFCLVGVLVKELDILAWTKKEVSRQRTCERS